MICAPAWGRQRGSIGVIGGWRDHYRKINEGEPVTINGRRVRYLNGPPVDAADVLPDGRRLSSATFPLAVR